MHATSQYNVMPLCYLLGSIATVGSVYSCVQIALCRTEEVPSGSVHNPDQSIVLHAIVARKTQMAQCTVSCAVDRKCLHGSLHLCDDAVVYDISLVSGATFTPSLIA